MPILMRIVLRNLQEHKSKSLIVGILIALGILILTLGNSILTTASVGLEKAYIDSFTGHILVRTKADDPVSIYGSNGEDIAGMSLLNYPMIYDYVTSQPQVLAANPQITIFCVIDLNVEGQNRGALAPTIGIEPESYLTMFPDAMEITQGRFLETGEAGIMLPKVTVDTIRDDFGEELNIGDEIKITVRQQGRGGIAKLRRFPLVGVYTYTSEGGNTRPFAIIDATSVRSLAGMVIGSADVINIDEADSSLLDNTSKSSDAEANNNDVFFDEITNVEETDFLLNEESLFNILGDTTERSIASTPDAGSWSYLLVRLQSDNQTDSTIEEFNAFFNEKGLPVEAINWYEASGGIAQFNRAVQIFFYVVVIILTVVSIIIIMNTLIISVIERTKEIGTMRSLGAQRKVVRQMFILETMSISLLSGTIGLILGVLLLLLSNRIGIKAPNAIFELIFNASTLRPIISVQMLLINYLVMVIIGFISSLYPVHVALKIQPLEAMQSI